MKIKMVRCCVGGGIAMSLAFLAVLPTIAYTGQKLAKEAKISMSQARSIALKAHPGKITDEELERERGGSGLRYSFDIKSGGITQEVGVDAKTGKVLENTPRKAHTPTERELDGRIVVQTSNRQGSGRPADLTAISLAKALLGRAGGEGWTPSMATVRAAAR